MYDRIPAHPRYSRVVRIVACALMLIGHFALSATAIGSEPAASTEEPNFEIHVFRSADGVESHCLIIGWEFTDDDMIRLQKFPQLKVITFFGTSTTGAGLKHLIEFPHLEEIHFIGTFANDNSAEPVSKMKGLKSLSIRNIVSFDYLNRGFEINGDTLKNAKRSGITDHGARKIAECKNLKSLFIRSGKLSEAGLSNILDIPSLRNLQLSGCQLSGTFGSRLRDSKIENLYLEQSEVSDGFIEAIQGSNSLQNVFFDRTQITDEMAIDFSKMRNLKTLGISQSGVSKKTIDILNDAIPFTTILWPEFAPKFKNSHGQPAGWETFATFFEIELTGEAVMTNLATRTPAPSVLPLDNLQTYSAQARTAPVYESVLPLLRFHDGITSVAIHASPIRAEYLDPIGQMKTLKRVAFSGITLGEDYVIDFLKTSASRENLEEVILDGLLIQNRTTVELATLPGLKRLSLQNTPITRKDVEELVKCKHLELLDLSSCTAITDESLEVFARIPKLKTLDIGDTSCTPEAVERFATQRLDINVFFVQTEPDK